MAPDPDMTLGEVGRAVERMERRLDLVIVDIEARLRRVERWMYAVPGSVFVGASAIIVALISRL